MLRSRKNFWMKTGLSRTIRSGSRPTKFVLFPRMRFFSEQNSPQKTRRRKEFCGCNQKYESCSDDRNREAGQETLRDPERVQQDSPGRQPWARAAWIEPCRGGATCVGLSGLNPASHA